MRIDLYKNDRSVIDVIMPRQAAQTRDEILTKAMNAIWDQGFHALSIDQLTRTTDASRQAIYSQFGNKHALYLECFKAYRETVVRPAIDRLFAAEDGLSAIDAYFEAQISLAESYGLPGPGCFVGNAMTETAPHDPHVRVRVESHNSLLKEAFASALASPGLKLTRDDQHDLANILLVAAQGIWAMSRVINSASELRDHAARFVSIVRERAQHV